MARSTKLLEITETVAPSRRTRSHITFDENNLVSDQEVDEEQEQGHEDQEDELEDESEDESESDSDAPEEETLRSGKQSIINKKQLEELAIIEQNRKVKEKRRLQDLKNKEQQKSKKVQFKNNKDDILDTLPMDLLESYDTNAENESDEDEIQDDEESENKPKKIKFNDDEEKELRNLMIKNKLKQAKLLNKNSIDKGPVTVKVLEKRKRMSVPINSIRSKKDKWLTRKNLKRS